MNINQIYLSLITTINLLLVVGMVYKVYIINSDKGVIIVLFFLPALLILNGIIWGIMKARVSKQARVFKINTILLLSLLLPVIILCAFL